MNRRAVLMRLQHLGAASRVDLAKALELSQPTVGKIVDELIRLGILEEAGDPGRGAALPAARSGAGRPARRLSLNASRPRFLGIHLDVKETRFARLPVEPRRTDEWDLVLPTATTGTAWVKTLRHARSRLGNRALLGVVLSVPGVLDDAAGRVLFSPNLHWTEKVFLPETIREAWPLPVVMVQELKALALGYRTVERLDEDFLAVDVGEGVGAAAVVGDRLYSSQLPISGELGHTPVDRNARPCGCGAIGCLETLVSRRGLLQTYSEKSQRANPGLDDLARQVRQRGIPAWLQETLEATGRIIGGALNVMGLRKVVVSGILSALPPGAHAVLEDAITRSTLWQRFGEVACVIAPRHHTAGLAAVGLDRFVAPTGSSVQPADPPRETRTMAA